MTNSAGLRSGEAAWPTFLLRETIVRENGASPGIELGPAKGRVLLVTLGITRIIEQESIDVAIYGSSDGVNWGARPLLAFPQKFYCGTYSMLLDLSGQADITHIRVQWKLNRWGRGEPTPLFGLYLFAQPLEAGVLAAARASS